jgi:hypothetical protein
MTTPPCHSDYPPLPNWHYPPAILTTGDTATTSTTTLWQKYNSPLQVYSNRVYMKTEEYIDWLSALLLGAPDRAGQVLNSLLACPSRLTNGMIK